MFRIKLLFIVAFLSNISFCQIGGIAFEVFETINCSLNDLKKTNDFSYLVQNKKGDTLLIGNYDPEKELFLKIGDYTVRFYLKDNSEIKVCDIEVTADRIRFVKVLFEENCELSRREVRARKKQHFANY